MPDYIWRVMVEIKSSFNPVSMLWYATVDYEDAWDYFKTRQHLVTKKRKIFVKRLGDSRRYYSRPVYYEHPPDPEPPPAIELPAPPTMQQTGFDEEVFKSVWRNEPPIKRRL